MSRISLLKYLLLLFCLPSICSSQNDINFKHLLTSDGLIQGYIHCMYQDHKGYIWIGTFSNLQRYNGYNFTNYTFIPEDSTTISANTVYSIAEDSNNNLWLGTERGLNLYYPESNTFKRFLHHPTDSNSLGHNHIRSIVITKNNIIWIGTYGGGIDRFDPENGIFQHYRNIEGDSTSLISDMVNTLFLDKNDRLWVGTENGGLSVFNSERNNFKNYTIIKDDPYSLKSNIINSITQDEDGLFWIGTWYDGLFSFDKKNNKFTQYKHKLNDPGSLPSNTIRKVLVDPYNKLWLASHSGLILFDKNTGIYKNFTNIPENNKSVISNTLASLLYTNEGILMVGSFGAGISMYDKNHNKFNVYSKKYKDNTLLSNVVRDIYEDTDSEIWIATDNGISIYNRVHENYIHLLTDADPLIKNCRYIFKDSFGYYWIGNDLGLVRYTPDLKSYQMINIGNGVYAIHQDYMGDLWFGGWNTGLIKIPAKQLVKDRINEQSFVYYFNDPSDTGSIRNNTIWKIFEDKEKNLWIGNTFAAEIFDRKNDKFIPKFENYDAILDITEDDENNIWLATTGHGVLKYNSNSKKVDQYSVPEGMPNNIGLSIIQDNQGLLWISTENGLARFNPKTESFKNYSKADGLPSSFLSLGGYEKLSTGELAFGSDHGFFIFNPADLKENTIRPQLELTDFYIYQKSVTKENAADSSHILLNQPVNQIKEIILDHTDNMITFEFTAVSFSLTEKISYSYFLEGFDKGWNNVDNEHKATYTNLSPGNYNFRVKAYNNDGYLGKNELLIKLLIKPPYWHTWWFRVIIALVLLMLIYLAYTLRVNILNTKEVELTQKVAERTSELAKINETVTEQKEELEAQTESLKDINKSLEISKNDLSRHKEILEEKVKERTEELIIAKERAEESDRLKSAFLANMSHEIRTPMNAIVGFSSLLERPDFSDEEKSAFIEQVKSNSESLLILIDDILDLSAMEAKDPVINNELFNVNSLMDELCSYWSLKSENTHVEFRFNNNINNSSPQINSDKHRIKQIISNFISNAFKFTEKGYVELGLTMNDGKVVIYVKDTGIGISKEHIELVFQRFRKIESHKTRLFRGVGLGMAISKHLAELLGAELWVQSEVNVGSTFYFSLPYKATDKGI
ncbi:hypothetical protein E9993_01290 [Labilibacter sediminis]|nr:hypothetical protein E9993_01290 [Labilibacter sediminis]